MRKLTLREKCPNTELFLVRIFLLRTEYGDLLRKSPYLVRIYLVRIQENTEQKQLRIWVLFTQCKEVISINFIRMRYSAF